MAWSLMILKLDRLIVSTLSTPCKGRSQLAIFTELLLKAPSRCVSATMPRHRFRSGRQRQGRPFRFAGMKERAERIGSKFHLFSSPDTGTLITLIVPGRSG